VSRKGRATVAALWMPWALIAPLIVGGCSHSEPQLGVGPNPLVFYVHAPKRAQTFGDFPMCNNSPDTTKIVITGIKVNDATPGLVVDGWGWSNSFGQHEGGIVDTSDESLQSLGFVTKPVELKMDCKKADANPLVLQPNSSPQFAVRMHATGTLDEWSKNGITVTYEQNGTPMETTFPYLYVFCGALPPHDPALTHCP